MLDGLIGSSTASGMIIFMCAKCKVRPEHAVGAENKSRQLVYLLICPKCTRIVGEWATIEERDKELRDLAAKISVL